ncbi:MAG: hypothetical protein ACRC11_13930, partial [Xenococcaceae cyanobacterium]
AQIAVNNFIETDFKIEQVDLSNPSLGLKVTPIFNPREGSGNAGTITITSTKVALEDFGSIKATSAGGNGGNIELTASELLKLRRNGEISTTAGLQGTGGNGGNININANLLVAFPKENSDITANAFEGTGGNIKIDSRAIFGLKAQPSLTSNSDITASSQLSRSGNITINTPDANPSKGETRSTLKSIEPDETVAQACDTDGSGALTNTFIITGRGGMPDDPTKPLNSIVIAGDKKAGGQMGEGVQKQISPDVEGDKKTFSSNEIIPARGMIINEKGQVVLTRYPTPNVSDSLQDSSASRIPPQSNYCSS